MDKILLITGASSDVGVSLLKKIYRDYSVIYLHYSHMNDKLQEAIDEIKSAQSSDTLQIIPVCADFGTMDGVYALIEEIKGTGILPNSIVHLPAPKLYNKQFNKDNTENFDIAWQICVRSITEILHAFIPNMAKQKYGRIVFMLTSSTLGIPAKYQASYVTAKYALLGLMKALSAEYSDRGITSNGISPDMMETKFLAEVPEMIIEKNASNSPIGRNIRIEEIIPVVEYMLSDSGASMTGQNIGITGGL